MTADLRLPATHRSASVPAMHHQAAPPPPPPRTTAKPPPSWRTIGLVGGGIAALVALIGIAAAVSPTADDTASTTTMSTTAPPAPTTPAPPTYKPFDQVEPFTSPYFITLEPTGLAERLGEPLLYELGLKVCRNLDSGATIADELAHVESLDIEESGTVVGAAVTDMCPQHGPAVEQYLATH